MPKERGGPLPTRVAELGENTGALPTPPLMTASSGASWFTLLMVEETKMIYLVTVNKSDGWVASLCSTSGRAGYHHHWRFIH